MKLSVTVKPNSKRPGVEQSGERSYIVHVNAPAHDGRANHAMTKALADHFHVPQSAISVLHGSSSKKKIVEIR